MVALHGSLEPARVKPRLPEKRTMLLHEASAEGRVAGTPFPLSPASALEEFANIVEKAG